MGVTDMLEDARCDKLPFVCLMPEYFPFEIKCGTSEKNKNARNDSG